MRKNKWICLLLACALTWSLTACGGGGGTGRDDVTPSPDPVVSEDPVVPEEPTPSELPSEPPVEEPSPEPPADPYEAVMNYWSADQLTQAWGPEKSVWHVFFHPVIAYPTWAFRDCRIPESQRKGLDDWMVTVDEYNEILDNLYEKDYILVRIEDVWSEVTDETGTHMVRNTLMLPEGKKPLIVSFDDVNYYQYMLEQGFTSKLLVGDDGQLWAECTDPYTGETFLTQDLDAVTILDQFVLEHPDFSLNGSKAVAALTGYQGILGYRTQTDRDITDPAELEIFEANRQKEIEAVKPVIQRMKETGWTFASHTWGHINLANKGIGTVKNDTERWFNEVGSLIGPTSILIYPHGGRCDGADWHNTGEIFRYMHEKGFRVFASVGVNDFSYIKPDISAVICDRMHPDGSTLRWSRDRYLHFYDAWDIIDLDVRPNMPYDRNPGE